MRIHPNRLRPAILTLFALALGSGAAAGDVYRYQFKSQGVDADFTVRDASGCIVTSAQVFASRDRERGTGTDDASTLPVGYVHLQRTDSCAGNRLLLSAVAYGTLDPAELRTHGHLDSAIFTATLAAYDSVSGTTRTIEVDLLWTATDRTAQIFDRSSLHGPGYRIRNRSHSMSRPAQTTGTIVLDGEEMISAPASYASIGDWRQGIFEVYDWRTLP